MPWLGGSKLETGRVRHCGRAGSPPESTNLPRPAQEPPTLSFAKTEQAMSQALCSPIVTSLVHVRQSGESRKQRAPWTRSGGAIAAGHLRDIRRSVSTAVNHQFTPVDISPPRNCVACATWSSALPDEFQAEGSGSHGFHQMRCHS